MEGHTDWRGLAFLAACMGIIIGLISAVAAIVQTVREAIAAASRVMEAAIGATATVLVAVVIGATVVGSIAVACYYRHRNTKLRAFIALQLAQQGPEGKS